MPSRDMAQRFDDGFTLVEVLVVIAILAILGTITVTNMPGVRSTAKTTSFSAAARSLDEGVKAFRQDHASRAPKLLDATDWPVARHGPIDSERRRYMRVTPDSIATGEMPIAASASGITSPTLVYLRPSETAYQIVVFGIKGVRKCWLGNVPVSGLREC